MSHTAKRASFFITINLSLVNLEISCQSAIVRRFAYQFRYCGIRNIKQQKPFRPRAFVHFPQVDEEYFKQLTPEACVMKRSPSGRIKLAWEVRYRENHALDCFIYAMGAYFITGAHKWTDERWQQLSCLPIL